MKTYKLNLLIALLVCGMYGVTLYYSNIAHAQNFGKDVVFERKEYNDVLSDKEYQRVKNIVRKSESYRGNEIGDMYYKMLVVDVKDKEVQSSTNIKVNVKQDKNTGERSSLTFIEDGSGAGNKILQSGPNMWFYKPGTANALRISPAQRFIGGASYADISSTNFTLYYDPVIIEDVTIGNANAYRIKLKKIKEGVSYDTIAIYVNKEDYKPIKAEFHTRSGKLVKTMYFRKFAKATNLGANSIISGEWTIVDNLDQRNVTNIQIRNVVKEVLPDINFTADGLLR